MLFTRLCITSILRLYAVLHEFLGVLPQNPRLTYIYMKRVLKTYANSITLASMRLMRSLSERLQFEQQVGPTGTKRIRKLRER